MATDFIYPHYRVGDTVNCSGQNGIVTAVKPRPFNDDGGEAVSVSFGGTGTVSTVWDTDPGLFFVARPIDQQYPLGDHFLYGQEEMPGTIVAVRSGGYRTAVIDAEPNIEFTVNVTSPLINPAPATEPEPVEESAPPIFLPGDVARVTSTVNSKRPAQKVLTVEPTRVELEFHDKSTGWWPKDQVTWISRGENVIKNPFSDVVEGVNTIGDQLGIAKPNPEFVNLVDRLVKGPGATISVEKKPRALRVGDTVKLADAWFEKYPGVNTPDRDTRRTVEKIDPLVLSLTKKEIEAGEVQDDADWENAAKWWVRVTKSELRRERLRRIYEEHERQLGELHDTLEKERAGRREDKAAFAEAVQRENLMLLNAGLIPVDLIRSMMSPSWNRTQAAAEAPTVFTFELLLGSDQPDAGRLVSVLIGGER